MFKNLNNMFLQTTLDTLEELLEKPFFTQENIKAKTSGNEAAGKCSVTQFI